MRTDKEVKKRIEGIKEKFFKQTFDYPDKPMSGGQKVTLREMKISVRELRWVLGIDKEKAKVLGTQKTESGGKGK